MLRQSVINTSPWHNYCIFLWCSFSTKCNVTHAGRRVFDQKSHDNFGKWPFSFCQNVLGLVKHAYEMLCLQGLHNKTHYTIELCIQNVQKQQITYNFSELVCGYRRGLSAFWQCSTNQMYLSSFTACNRYVIPRSHINISVNAESVHFCPTRRFACCYSYTHIIM